MIFVFWSITNILFAAQILPEPEVEDTTPTVPRVVYKICFMYEKAEPVSFQGIGGRVPQTWGSKIPFFSDQVDLVYGHLKDNFRYSNLRLRKLVLRNISSNDNAGSIAEDNNCDLTLLSNRNSYVDNLPNVYRNFVGLPTGRVENFYDMTGIGYGCVWNRSFFRRCMRSQTMAIVLGNFGVAFRGYGGKNYLAVPGRSTLNAEEREELERRAGIVPIEEDVVNVEEDRELSRYEEWKKRRRRPDRVTKRRK